MLPSFFAYPPPHTFFMNSQVSSFSKKILKQVTHKVFTLTVCNGNFANVTVTLLFVPIVVMFLFCPSLALFLSRLRAQTCLADQILEFILSISFLFLLEIICFTNFKLFLLASSFFACIGMIMVLYVCMHVVPLILLLEMSIWIYFLVQFCLLFWCGLILEKKTIR